MPLQNKQFAKSGAWLRGHVCKNLEMCIFVVSFVEAPPSASCQTISVSFG